MATKKGKAKVEEEFVIDGSSITEKTRPQLMVLALRLHKELTKEKEDRNLMQLERDTLHTFHEIYRQQLKECQAGLRLLEHENESAEDKHEIALKHVAQKVKFLVQEQESHLKDATANTRTTLKTADDEFVDQKLKLSEDNKNLKQQLTDTKLASLDQMENLKMQCREDMSEARIAFLDEKNQLQRKADKNLMEMRDELTLKFRMELTELENRKNKQIDDLVKHHESAFSNMKYYFNDITDNNLSLIKGLKEQLKDLQKKLDDATMREKELKRRLALGGTTERRQRCSTSSAPGTAGTAAASDPGPGTPHRASGRRGGSAVAETRNRLNSCKEAYENLMCENEILQHRIKKLEEERAGLDKQHRAALQELLQEADFQAVQRESRVSRLMAQLEREKARAISLVAGALEDPDLRDLVRDSLENLLSANNAQMQELVYELARVCKAHDDLLRAYEAKLRQHGVPVADLGFQPRRVDVKNLRLGRGPAGLVTVNK